MPKQSNQWVENYSQHVPKNGPVLDLACGSGRHGRLFLELGHPVTFADRNVSGLADLTGIANVTMVETDLENGIPWPPELSGKLFAGIVVVNYLYRPLFPRLYDSLTEGGVLIYQTFAQGNEKYGRPKNPDFLLRDNELLDYFGPKMEVIEFEQGLFYEPDPAVIQRICARKS